MTHPTTYLTDYVDGTLDAAERKRVGSHLASCEACAAEVADALKGRDALSSLSQVEVPAGVTSRVIREVRGSQGAGLQGKTSEPKLKLRMGRVYGLAAASIAAVMALVFVMGGHRPQVDSAAKGGAAMLAPAADMNKPDNEPGPLDLDGDYSASELSALAATEAQKRSGIPVPLPADQTVGGTAEGSLSAGSAATPDGSAPASKSAIRQSRRNTTPVVSPQKLEQCLRSVDAYVNGGTLADSFEARYDGLPAYFAVLLEPPEPGRPADKVVIWVLSRDGCDVMAFTQQRYPSATPSPLPTTFLEP